MTEFLEYITDMLMCFDTPTAVVLELFIGTVAIFVFLAVGFLLLYFAIRIVFWCMVSVAPGRHCFWCLKKLPDAKTGSIHACESEGDDPSGGYMDDGDTAPWL